MKALKFETLSAMERAEIRATELYCAGRESLFNKTLEIAEKLENRNPSDQFPGLARISLMNNRKSDVYYMIMCNLLDQQLFQNKVSGVGLSNTVDGSTEKKLFHYMSGLTKAEKLYLSIHYSSTFRKKALKG